jgi:hypothetical protein
MLDTVPIPDKIPEVEQLTIKQIVGKPREYTTELLRLFNAYAHDRDHLRALGIRKDEMSAHLVAKLPQPGGTLFVADTGRRLQALVYMEPDLEESAMLGHHVWVIKHLVLDPDVAPDTVPALMETAFMFLGGPAEFVKAYLPTSDFRAIRGLRDAGFRVVGGEIKGVVTPDRPSVHQLRGGALVKMKPSHIDSAAGLIRTCEHCNPYFKDARFDPLKVKTLYERRLNRCLKDPACSTLVIQERTGDSLGFVVYERDQGLEKEYGRRIAHIDHVCSLPDSSGTRQTDLLHRQALAVLWEEGIDAVTTKTPTSCDNTMHGLTTLKNIGYQVTRNDLIMHRGLEEPKRVTA